MVDLLCAFFFHVRWQTSAIPSPCALGILLNSTVIPCAIFHGDFSIGPCSPGIHVQENQPGTLFSKKYFKLNNFFWTECFLLLKINCATKFCLRVISFILNAFLFMCSIYMSGTKVGGSVLVVSWGVTESHDWIRIEPEFSKPEIVPFDGVFMYLLFPSQNFSFSFTSRAHM